MSLNFAAIAPHPPIIIPEIGAEEQMKAGSTVQAMKKLASIFKMAEIETLLVISPHMLPYPNQFSICGMKKLFGTFASFDAPDLMMEFQNDLELARLIDTEAQKQDIKTLLYDNEGEFFELDHGIMVPLYFLNFEQETPLKIVPLAYSNLSRSKHYSYGQTIGEILKTYPGRVGVIASGDLSHRLLQGSQEEIEAGYDFDKKIVNDIMEAKTEEILYYDEDFVNLAGECGYKSILILLGILDSHDLKPEILSYEGPFGVGYLVTNFKI